MILLRSCCDNEVTPRAYDTLVVPFSHKKGTSDSKLLPQDCKEEIAQCCACEFLKTTPTYSSIILYHNQKNNHGNDVHQKVCVILIEEIFGDEKQLQIQKHVEKICSHIFSACFGKRIRQLLVPAAELLKSIHSNFTSDHLRVFLEIFIRTLHHVNEQSDQFYSKAKPKPLEFLEEVIFTVDAENVSLANTVIENSKHIVSGIKRTQRLANLPANICSPDLLCKEALDLSRTYHETLSTTIHNVSALEKMKMNGILGVASGSKHPPYLIEIHYSPKLSKHKSPIAIVGKGITFDAGGISLKPANNMKQMKYDMCGAATVLGLIESIALLNIPIPIIGLIPTCENMVSHNSYRPGDILTLFSGLTIEVDNTDAEGRLILADAIAYAEKTFTPKGIIDIATLTGACAVALGSIRSGLFTNNREMEKDLFNAGEESGDRVWPMPMDPEYDILFESSSADWSNSATKRDAGSITAARFLSKFVHSTPWAHLDIAATSCAQEGTRYRATGRPVPLLLHYFLKQSEL